MLQAVTRTTSNREEGTTDEQALGNEPELAPEEPDERDYRNQYYRRINEKHRRRARNKVRRRSRNKNR